MTKPFHAGRSAHAGVMAARLAAAGFTASVDALEHPQGFLAAVSPEGNVDRDSAAAEGLGESWRITRTGLAVKKFPTCYCTHRAIDGMLELVREHDLKPADVAAITVTLSDNFATILRNHRPQTGLAAKFSIEFAMVCALVARRVGLGELTDEFVSRTDVQAMLPMVSVQISTEPDAGYPGAAFADQVTDPPHLRRHVDGRSGPSRARSHRQPADGAGSVRQIRGLPDGGAFGGAAGHHVRPAEADGAGLRPLLDRATLVDRAT